MTITIYGPPATKKNSMQIVKMGNRHGLIQSKRYREYESDFIKQITGDKKQAIDYPVIVKCEYYMPTKRRVDLTNLLSATHDCLVKAGVLEDDNFKIITSVDGSRVYHDKENPRVEIEVIPYDG